MADFGSLSADQINNSMGLGPGGVGAQGQNQLNNIFGNFGQQTDYYSGLGAAFGRNTGGFNGGDIYGGRDALAAAMTQQQPFQSYGLPTGGGGSTPKVAGYDDSWMGGRGFGAPTNASPSPQGLLGYTPSQPGAQLPNGFGYPGAMPPSQMFNPNTYAPPQQQSSGGGGMYRTAPGGGLYLDTSGGGGGGAAPAALQPPSEMQYYNSQWVHDRPMDQTPQNVFGHPGTLDRNTMDPSQLPGGGYSIAPQNAIQAMLQPQVMEGRS